MIRSIIFDIGNVLLPFNFNKAVGRIQSRCDLALECVAARFEPIKTPYESGQMGRDAFLRETTRVLDYRGTEEELTAAWQEIFEENEAMFRIVRSLHGRMPLYLLSNTNDLHVEYMFRQYPVFQCFTDAVYSHIARCCKPGREIYEVAERQFAVRPQEVLFIDDLPANVATAQAMGWNAVQYDFRNHAALLEEMRRLQVDGEAG